MAKQVELTVKRPNGNTEIVILPNETVIGKSRFEQIKKATKASGKGDVLSYRLLNNGREIVLATGGAKAASNKLKAGIALPCQSTQEVERMSAMGE